MVNIREATVADAVALAPRLREADMDECRAALGMKPGAVLPFLVQSGHKTWAVEDDSGTLFGLFGIDLVHANEHLGIIWAVSSPDIYKHRRALLKVAPKWIDKLHDIRPLLGNHIDARNTDHVRWLKRMGFSFLRTLPDHGVERRPFHEFARLRS